MNSERSPLSEREKEKERDVPPPILIELAAAML